MQIENFVQLSCKRALTISDMSTFFFNTEISASAAGTKLGKKDIFCLGCQVWMLALKHLHS